MVFVIMIVSILSSVAIPKLSDTSSAARIAVMKSTAATIRTSAEYTRGLYLMQRERKDHVHITDANVKVLRGYPVSYSIKEAAGLSEYDFYVEEGEEYTRIYPKGIPQDDNCVIVYEAPTTDGFITKPPKVHLKIESC